MSEGWISLYRQLQDNELWFMERFTKAHAWIDLLLLANHKANVFYIRGNELRLKRGELGYSVLTLSKRWKWNRRTVDNFLSMLSKRQMIHTRKTNLTTIISIVNYDKYQNNAQQTAQQSSNRLHTNNNDNNFPKFNTNGNPDSVTNRRLREIYYA